MDYQVENFRGSVCSTHQNECGKLEGLCPKLYMQCTIT